MADLDAILLDIEGTTTPIAFVHQVLFPYARAGLPALLRDRAGEHAVAEALGAVRSMAPGIDPLTTLLGWMDRDEKATPLKALQGIIWNDGYADGSLQGAVYPDVAPALRAWRAAGLRLAVYSSGSVAAQRLIFGHSTAGDLRPLFAEYFDTTTGPKRATESYHAIALRLQVSPPRLLFLSDIAEELDAATTAGLATCQLVRAADGTKSTDRHATATDFDDVARQFGI